MYKAKEPMFLWLLLILLAMVYGSMLDQSYQWFAYGVVIVLLLVMTTSYQFIPEQQQLTYRIVILGKTIVNRVLRAEDIKKIIVIAIGSRTIILIYPKSGMRIKLHRFVPDGLESEVRVFATAHQIPVEEQGK